MNAILKMLRPTALLGILFLVVLLAQGAFFATHTVTYSMTRSTGSDAPDKTESSFGIGAPVTITTANGATTYDINWLGLAGNILCCYILAVILSKAFTRATRFRRPALAYGFVALVMIVASFCVAIGFSRMEWGYYFSRPGVLQEMSDITAVSSVIPVKTIPEEGNHRRIVVQDDYSIAKSLEYAKEDPYYCLDERLLFDLEKRGLLPSHPSTDLSGLPDIFSLVRDTGILATPSEGYNDSDILRGIVIDAMGKSGQRLVFLGLTGMQLSNDHYPYYELVFSGTAGSETLSYIHGQRFFYDVAGIEGAEWYVIWPVLALIGIIGGFAVFTIVILLWKVMRRIKTAQQPPAPYAKPGATD